MSGERTARETAMGGGGADGIGTAGLEELARLGDGRLEPELLERLQELGERAAARLARSRERVVIALAGGTGSGKSSLTNALLGQEVSRPGVRRPTTDSAVAVTVGCDTGAEALLDWLRVFERRAVPAEGSLAALDGAVLLDLPDVDSVISGHWSAADRLIERCDLLVWVLDPLKYGQALAHQHYFSRLAHHAELFLAVLNHADRLAAADRQACQDHLRELLDGDGLGRARLLTASAQSGEGVEALRRALGEEVRARRAPVAYQPWPPALVGYNSLLDPYSRAVGQALSLL